MAQQTDSITRSIDIAAPVSRVWRALTDQHEFGQWFGVMLETPIALGQTVSGRVTYPGYEHLPFDFIVDRMEPEKLLVWRWQPGIDVRTLDDPDLIYTTVTFTLEPIPDGTRLTITETGFSALPPERYAEAFRLNTQGWDEQVGNIKRHAEA